MEAIYREFGRRLREYREAAELSQQGLAERVGISRTSVTNIEKGNQRISLHLALQFAKVLGTDIGSLLRRDSAPQTEPFDEVLAGHQLRPSAKAQVQGVLRKLSEDDQKWVGRVISQASTEGRRGKSRRTGTRTTR